MRAADERDRLADSLRKKGLEVSQMHQEIERLAGLINEQSSKRQEYSTRNLRLEIEDLTDQLRRSEGETNRVKSVVALKEEYTAKL
jgi:arginine deiminase